MLRPFFRERAISGRLLQHAPESLNAGTRYRTKQNPFGRSLYNCLGTILDFKLAS